MLEKKLGSENGGGFGDLRLKDRLPSVSIPPAVYSDSKFNAPSSEIGGQRVRRQRVGILIFEVIFDGRLVRETAGAGRGFRMRLGKGAGRGARHARCVS